MIKKIILIILCFGLFAPITYSQITSSSFATKVDFISGTGSSTPQGIVAGDLDLDGNQDVVVTNGGITSLSVFRNTSTFNNISFAAKIDLATVTNPCFVYLMDIDYDGKLDIVFGYLSGTQFSIFRNTTTAIGSITFATRQDFAANSVPSSCAFGDLDGDNKIDLVFPNFSSGNVSVYKNNSTPGNIVLATKLDYTTGSGPSTAVVYDIDGDTRNDICITNYNSNTISILRNTYTTVGTIALNAATGLTTLSLPNFMKADDVDGDGRKDLVYANYGSNSFSVYKNNSYTPGSIVFATRLDFATGTGTSSPQGIAIKDLDGDLKPEISINNRTNNTLSVFRNLSTSGTVSLGTAVTFTTGSNPTDIFAVDLDNDIKCELIETNNGTGSSTFSVFRNLNLFTTPSLESSGISFSNVGNNNMNITFSKGNGARRIVICKQGSSVNSAPVNGTPYTANSNFGNGSQLGTGNYVIYSDTGSAFSLSGLTANTTYYFSVYEYNGISGYSNFLTSAFLTGSRSTANTTIYFSKSTGNLNTLSTWGTATDGSGTAPVSFSTPNSYYYIFNNPAPTMSANLTITGGNTALVVGDGVNTYNFSIPSGFTLTTDTLVVKKFATLTVNGTLAGSTNIFEDTSTAQFTGASAQDLPTASYYNLVTSSALKTMTGNVVVRNNFVMMSSVNMNSYAMMLGTSALLRGTLNRTSGTLYGGTLMRWFTNATNTGSTGLFPIGTSTDYRPVQIDYTTAPTSGGSLSAAFVTTSPSQTGLPFFDFNTASSTININAIGSNGTWQLSPSTLSGGQFTGFFTASAFTGVSSYADLRLVRRASSGSAWSTTGISQAATGSNAIPVVSRTGMTLFGEFGIGGDVAVNALPVKIIILSVQQDNNSNALLKWETASELNSDHFEILRSVDDIDWTSLGKVASAGNSNEIRKYAFADDIKSFINRETKTIYYRLKQVDKDGSVAYSNIITVNLKTATNAVTLYPLPISNILHAVSNNGETVIGVSLFDISGKELITTTNGKMDVSTLAEGVYIAKVTTDRDVYYQKITK